jgi:hypothetical protein
MASVWHRPSGSLERIGNLGRRLSQRPACDAFSTAQFNAGTAVCLKLSTRFAAARGGEVHGNEQIKPSRCARHEFQSRIGTDGRRQVGACLHKRPVTFTQKAAIPLMASNMRVSVRSSANASIMRGGSFPCA